MTSSNALQLAQLGQLVDNVAESAYKGFQNLGQTLPTLPDEARCCLTLIRYCSLDAHCVGYASVVKCDTKGVPALVQETSSVAPPARHTPETAASACADRVVKQGTPSSVSQLRMAHVNYCTWCACVTATKTVFPEGLPQVKSHCIIQAAATKEVGKVLAKARNHADSIRQAADQLFYLNQELQASNVPVHDVHTARQVLETGDWTHILPACSSAASSQSSPSVVACE